MKLRFTNEWLRRKIEEEPDGLACEAGNPMFMFNEKVLKAIESDFEVLQIAMILNSFSDNSCLVGGCVRDILMDKTPKDFDFVTDIDYNKLTEIFTEAGFDVKEAGEQFLVCIVSKNGKQMEIVNYRKDGTYVDGRRPEAVEIGTLQEDAERRDFTVNALYFNLKTNQIVDPTGKGLADINDRVLRFIGRAKDRIEEDKLRVFRFYRFLTKGFTPNPKCLRTVRTYFNQACTETAGERIRNEVEKIVGVE